MLLKELSFFGMIVNTCHLEEMCLGVSVALSKLHSIEEVHHTRRCCRAPLHTLTMISQNNIVKVWQGMKNTHVFTFL